MILDGIGRVIEDGEIMGAHLANLRKMGKRLQTCNVIDGKNRPKLTQGG